MRLWKQRMKQPKTTPIKKVGIPLSPDSNKDRRSKNKQTIKKSIIYKK